MSNETSPETPKIVEIVVGKVETLEIDDREVSARFVIGNIPVKVPRSPRPGKPSISDGRLNAITFTKEPQIGILYHVVFSEGSKPITLEQLESVNPNTKFIISVQEENKEPSKGSVDEKVLTTRERLFGTILDRIDERTKIKQQWCQWFGLSEDKVQITLNGTTTKPEDLAWLQVNFIKTGNILKIQNRSNEGHEIGNVREVRWAKIDYTKKSKDGSRNDYIRLQIQFNEGQPKQHCEIWLKEDGRVTVTEITHL